MSKTKVLKQSFMNGSYRSLINYQKNCNIKDRI